MDSTRLSARVENSALRNAKPLGDDAHRVFHDFSRLAEHGQPHLAVATPCLYPAQLATCRQRP